MAIRLTHLRSALAPTVALFLVFFVVVATTILIRPYVGNMDDGRLLSLAQSGGPLHFANYLAGGTETGFIRATSMVIVWPTYLLGTVAGPVWFYLANTLWAGSWVGSQHGWVLCSCQHLCYGRTRQNSSSSQAFPRRG